MYYTISNNIIQCKKQKQDSHLTVAAPYLSKQDHLFGIRTDFY